jgi:O-succinylhomoserine sulfhydrylase
MKAQSEQALAIAQWLEAHPAVESVFYPGLASHPQAELISKQQTAGGAVLSFRVAGGRSEAWKIIDAVQIFSRSANLGDVKSIITHPATTTHGRVPEVDRLAAGITENLIRLSIGLESLDDLKADLARGLEA